MTADDADRSNLRKIINGELGGMIARGLTTVGVPALLAGTGWLISLVLDGHNRLTGIHEDVKAIIQVQANHETRIMNLENRRQ